MVFSHLLLFRTTVCAKSIVCESGRDFMRYINLVGFADSAADKCVVWRLPGSNCPTARLPWTYRYAFCARLSLTRSAFSFQNLEHAHRGPLAWGYIQKTRLRFGRRGHKNRVHFGHVRTRREPIDPCTISERRTSNGSQVYRDLAMNNRSMKMQTSIMPEYSSCLT